MLSRTQSALAIILLGSTAGIAAPPKPLPADTLVMFWAAWCAPCRVELTEFDKLAAAALPKATMMLGVDGERANRALLARLPREQTQIVDEPLPALFDRLNIRGPVALPLSVMTDARGRICATIRGGATPAAIVAAKRECAALSLP